MAKVTKKTTKATVKLDTKSIDELRAELVTSQTDLVEARRSHASRELSNTGRISELRKQIARIKTAIVKVAKEEKK